MVTPVILYAASGVPIGPQGAIAAKLQFYRPPAALDAAGLDYVAAVVPFGSESTGTGVGSPIIVTKVGIEFNSTMHNTTGRYGQSNNDPTVLRGSPTLNLSTFIQGAGQASLMVGDYISVAIGWKITSVPATPVAAAATRWFIDVNSLNTSGPNEWNIKLAFDRVNSDPAFNLF